LCEARAQRASRDRAAQGFKVDYLGQGHTTDPVHEARGGTFAWCTVNVIPAGLPGDRFADPGVVAANR
jgi:hypothetical protein